MRSRMGNKSSFGHYLTIYLNLTSEKERPSYRHNISLNSGLSLLDNSFGESPNAISPVLRFQVSRLVLFFSRTGKVNFFFLEKLFLFSRFLIKSN